MMLDDFLRLNGLTLAQFAARCGTSATTILRAREGQVVPSRRVLDAIWEATDGQVTPNDLTGLQPKGGER